MDCMVHGVAKSRTRLRNFRFTSTGGDQTSNLVANLFQRLLRKHCHLVVCWGYCRQKKKIYRSPCPSYTGELKNTGLECEHDSPFGTSLGLKGWKPRQLVQLFFLFLHSPAGLKFVSQVIKWLWDGLLPEKSELKHLQGYLPNGWTRLLWATCW